MIITQLIKKNNKIIIVFDSGEDIRIHYDVFVRNGLRRGDDLSDNQIASLRAQCDLLYAKESALRLLGRRIHSIKEIHRKLLQKKYSIELIGQVIDYLCEAGYLDDAVFTRQYIHEKTMRKDGIQKIRNELINKGVSKEIINQEMAHLDRTDEHENAIKIAAKKTAQLKARGIEGNKLKQKVYAFLISKGYDFDLIREVLDHNHIEE